MRLIVTFLFLLPTFLYGQCSVVTNSTDAVCYGDCTGFIQAIGIGSAPIDYSWSSGDSTAVIPNACAGTYTLTMTDDTGCVAMATVVISEPPELIVTLDLNWYLPDSSCVEITPLISGGSPYYFHQQWYYCSLGTYSGPILAPDSSYYLCNVELALIVQDNNGCTDTSECFSIGDPWSNLNEVERSFSIGVIGKEIRFLEPVNNIKIYGTNGSLIYYIVSSEELINLTGIIENGLYLITFEDQTGNHFVKKVFLQE